MKTKLNLLLALLMAFLPLMVNAQNGWSVVSSSSEETTGEPDGNGPASCVLDGDLNTYWHTAWLSGSSQYPHSITLMHDGGYSLQKINIFTLSSRVSKYCATGIQVEISTNGTSWNNCGIYNVEPAIQQTITLNEPVAMTYVRLTFKQGNGQYLVISELTFEEEAGELPEPFVDDSPIINFKDPAVKAICVQNWDLNGDGELSKHEAEQVTDLGKIFLGKTNITSFDELQYFTGLKSIGYVAFSHCSSLKTITIPNSVISIGNEAFSSCFALTTINIPDGVPSIGDFTFQYCYKLTKINIPNSVTSIGSSAFYGGNRLSKVIVPDINSFCRINFGENGSPFYNSSAKIYSDENTEVNDLVIGDDITSFDDKIFGSVPLNSISFGKNLQTINLTGKSPYTYHFTTAVPPTGSISFSSDANIYVPADAVETYRETWPDYELQIFSEANAKLLSIQATAKNSSSGMLQAIGAGNEQEVVRLKVSGTINGYDIAVIRNKMPRLRYLDLSDASIVYNKYTYYLSYTSQNNTVTASFTPASLDTIIMPKNLTEIAGDAFSGSKIRYFNIPASVTTIGTMPDSFFDRCTIRVETEECGKWFEVSGYSYSISIAKIELAEGVKTIAANAFEGFSYLSEIELPTTLTTIGEDAFRNIDYVEDNYNNVSCGTFNIYIKDLQSYMNIDFKNEYSHPIANYTKIYDENSYSSDLGDVNLFLNNELVKDLVIPEGTDTIKPYMFRYMNMASVTIPKSVKSIGEDGFNRPYDRNIEVRIDDISSWCKLNFVGALSSPAYQGAKLVVNGEEIEDLVIPDDIKALRPFALAGFKNLKSVKLPNGLTSIEYCAFENCSEITEISLPPTLKSIGGSVFGNCSNLKTINAFMPDLIPIEAYTFNDYQHQTLNIPDFLYGKYYYDENWGKFLKVNRTKMSSGDYTELTTNTDNVIDDGDQRIPHDEEDNPIDCNILDEGSITVIGDEPQDFSTVEIVSDGKGASGSLIGDDDGKEQGNIVVDHLRFRISVEAEREYTFFFPYDLNITTHFQYPEGQHKWWLFDGSKRATNGSSGRQLLTGETLHALEGYVFMAQKSGELVITIDEPTLGGERPIELSTYTAEAAQNANWNCLGNPYSCFYDFSVVDFTQPIIVWNTTKNTYEAFRPGDDDCHLEPYQAFYVQKPADQETITFSPTSGRLTYRESQAVQTEAKRQRKLKGTNPARRFVNMQLLNGDSELDHTRVVINEAASAGYEMECDASKFISEIADAQLYTIEDTVQMAINERPQAGDIRLGYIANKAMTLTIEAASMELNLKFIDRLEQQVVDLTKGAYTFSTEAGTFNDRFILNESGEYEPIKQDVPQEPEDPQVITDVSQLSNNQKYIIRTRNEARGSLGVKNGMLASTNPSAFDARKCDAESPFAIIKYNGQFYLYSTADESFIDRNGYETNNPGKEGEHAVTITRNTNGYFMFQFTKTGYYLNVNNNPGIAINTWGSQTYEWDDGDQFTIEPAGDFDPEAALAMLIDKTATHYAQTPVQTVGALNNNAVYTATTERAAWYVAKDGTCLMSDLKPNSVSRNLNDKGFMFSIINCNDSLFIYSVGEGKILNGEFNGKSNQLVTEQCQPVKITATGNADYPFFFSFDSNHNINIDGSGTVYIDYWTTIDQGNRVALRIVEDVTLTDEEVTSIQNMIRGIGTGIDDEFTIHNPEPTIQNNPLFDLSGRRIANSKRPKANSLRKGIYIAGRRKVLVK